MKWCNCLKCGREGRAEDTLLFEENERGIDGYVCTRCDSDTVTADEVEDDDIDNVGNEG